MNSRFNHLMTPLLYMLFALCSVSILLVGARVLERVSSRVDSVYEIRTALSYVAVKIRQGDIAGQVFIKDTQAGPSLIIQENYDDLSFQTIIYEYNSALYGIYIEEGLPFNLADGTRITGIHSICFDLRDNVVTISAESPNGQQASASVALRAQ